MQVQDLSADWIKKIGEAANKLKVETKLGQKVEIDSDVSFF